MTTLGRLEQVDLRHAWQSEPGGFTPWLAQEDNLKLLGDTIGIDLELEAQEKNVGPFRADILCKNTADGQWVLVENQLERTDHTHLGQLMTYAAGLKAVTIVWIANRFTDEHRAALDWLNDITDDRFNFFALEIELWRIGDSSVAPKFNVVSKPNDWSRTVTTTTRGADAKLSETQLMQRDYWAGLRACLIERKSPVKSQKPLPQSWTIFAVGRSNFWLWASMHTRKNTLSAGLTCGGPDEKKHFNLLKEERIEIQAEIENDLIWVSEREKKTSWVCLTTSQFDPKDQSTWTRQHQWFSEKLEQFHRSFAPRVKSLDAFDHYDEPVETIEK